MIVRSSATKRNRNLQLSFCLLLVLAAVGMLPGTSSPAFAVGGNAIVGGTSIANLSNNYTAGNNWNWSANDRTLELQSGFTGSISFNVNAPTAAYNDITIVLTDDVTLASGNTISSNGPIVFKTNGHTLRVDDTGSSHAIQSTLRYVTFEENSNVVLSSASASALVVGEGMGIYDSSSLTITSSGAHGIENTSSTKPVIINTAGTVAIATTQNAIDSSYTVDIVKGTVKLSSSAGRGINAAKKITIGNSANVSTNPTTNGAAIYSQTDIALQNNAIINVTSLTANAIEAGKNISIANNANVTATTKDGSSYALKAQNTATAITIAGGTTTLLNTITSANTTSPTAPNHTAGTLQSGAIGAPTITAISPTNGNVAAGETVTITGTNLTNATVTVDGTTIPASTFITTTATEISFAAPAGGFPAGAKVTVTVGSDTATKASAFAKPTTNNSGGDSGGGCSTGGFVPTLAMLAALSLTCRKRK